MYLCFLRMIGLGSILCTTRIVFLLLSWHHCPIFLYPVLNNNTIIFRIQVSVYIYFILCYVLLLLFILFINKHTKILFRISSNLFEFSSLKISHSLKDNIGKLIPHFCLVVWLCDLVLLSDNHLKYETKIIEKPMNNETTIKQLYGFNTKKKKKSTK